MPGKFVINGATLKCPLCSSSGTLVVSHTEVQLQDVPWATNGDRNKSNLVFGGVCNKWRKNKPPCASVISPTQWQGLASDVEIDGELMLVEDSTIKCATGGVDIAIEDTAQIDVPTDLPDSENAVLKKFLVNVRRPEDYKGEYGFDWLRDEYIYPIETIDHNNTNDLDNVPLPVCKNPDDLKNEYKTKDVVSPISPYGIDYYPAWLSIFPDTEEGYVNQVQLNIEIEEIEPLQSDETEIIFECDNENLIVTPEKIPLNDLLLDKQTKNWENTTKDYYLAEKVITVKCEGGVLEDHQEIKIFAELKGEKEEVGKLMVYKNSTIPSFEIVVVDVSIAGNPTSYNTSFYYPLLKLSFTQAMIKPVVVDTISFDISLLPLTAPVVRDFTEMYINTPTLSNADSNALLKFEDDLLYLFSLYNEVLNPINSNASKKTYIFRTPFKPLHPHTGEELRGMAYADHPDKEIPGWGNSIVLFPFGLLDDSNMIHELGHSLSLPHTFEEKYVSPFTFYQGFTDNHMDYFNQYDPNPNSVGLPNPNINNMYSFFKWQWDIMREDRSLIYENTSLE
ncbi:DUF4280 domain-containing protein [Aquimarina sp. I32.4]|uniref:DUF4280 domain-containing protein n=1 Tax=Aquimarina sp. I32.4 TaxID=2053903 RepID=UPI000CDF1A3B|nr:DUF4280 domain-containing protein [Aquimarina sp. I32.4]